LTIAKGILPVFLPLHWRDASGTAPASLLVTCVLQYTWFLSRKAGDTTPLGWAYSPPNE